MDGRVEICFSRRWGTISGDGWTETESTVVCNDLGYETTGRLGHNFYAQAMPFNDNADTKYSVRIATNSMPVYVKNVRCSGRELSALECSFRRNLTPSVHIGDVGVKCKKCKKTNASTTCLRH